jgi:hypothetical protein
LYFYWQGPLVILSGRREIRHMVFFLPCSIAMGEPLELVDSKVSRERSKKMLRSRRERGQRRYAYKLFTLLGE